MDIKINRSPTKFALIMLIILLCIILAELLISLFLYLNPQTKVVNTENEDIVYFSNKTDADLESDIINTVTKQPKNIKDIKVMGWIPDWDLADGFNTLKNNSSTFSEVSPFWLMPQDDGSLKEVKNNVNPDIISYTKSNHIELIPTIPLFKAETLTGILNNPDNYKRHMDQILQKVSQYNYDGIDLDYESIYLKDKKILFKFLSELSDKLHANKKKLVFTALSKIGDEFYSIQYPSLIQTRLTEDYKQISDLVDEFRIMTYEFTDRSSAKAGPIAPIKWQEYVLKYAIHSGVPREKIVLGVHNYIYEWSDRPLANDEFNLLNWYSEIKVDSNLPRASAYYYKDLEKLKQSYQFTEQFNDSWGEMVLKYNYKGQNRIAIYMNDKSIQLRKQLAADYGIKGISYWRLGDEGSLKL